MQHSDRRRAIAALGHDLGPDVLTRCMALYEAEQREHVAGERRVADLAYGPDSRQRLDLYLPRGGKAMPLVLFVHGGGFVRGDKHVCDHPFNAHVGRYAATHGFVGAVMNYRLAPEHRWPSGGDDVAAAIAWLRRHGADHGADAAKIVLLGTSAGSVHVATCLKRHGAASPVSGAVLLSGLYGATPAATQDRLYFGDEDPTHASVATMDALAGGGVPLLVACAEFDPPRFQSETLALLGRVLATRGRLPRARVVAGHNHYTLAMHLGTRDAALGDEIAEFVRDVTGTAVAVGNE